MHENASAITLRAGVAELDVSPAVGGALTRFTWRDRPVLRPTPADALADGNVRLTSSYPLAPYSNRIRHARLHACGESHALRRNFGEHPHSIHGVGWQRAWSVEEALPQRARLTLRHDASGADRADWPWPFRATQGFALHAGHAAAPDAAVLSLTLAIENTGTAPFPFGLGWHPFFAKQPSTELAFRADGVWLNDPTQLPVRRVAVPPEWRFDQRRTVGDLSLDNVFTGWDGSASLRDRESAMQVTLAADRACRFLVVYAPPSAGFVALEPVTHETDAFNRAADGAPDTGTRVLAPGATFSCTMRIIAAALD